MRTGVLIGLSSYTRLLDGQIIGYLWMHVQAEGDTSTGVLRWITLNDGLAAKTIHRVVINHAGGL